MSIVFEFVFALIAIALAAVALLGIGVVGMKLWDKMTRKPPRG